MLRIMLGRNVAQIAVVDAAVGTNDLGMWLVEGSGCVDTHT